MTLCDDDPKIIENMHNKNKNPKKSIHKPLNISWISPERT
jgi:hypothetical protein